MTDYINNLQKEKIKILVVDDEENIVEFIKMGLEAEGFIVHTAMDGNKAILSARELNPHIVLLDIMIPGMDGFEVCTQIKKTTKTAIIMLTAKDDIEDCVRGLNLGADDYITKPFSFKELIARINARLRNTFPELSNTISVGAFRMDDGAHEVFYHDRMIMLSLTEYSLLRLLLFNNGIVLSKQTIIEKVWGFDFNGDENIVEVYIRYLRDKIGDSEHSIIRTVRGVGYKVVAA